MSAGQLAAVAGGGSRQRRRRPAGKHPAACLSMDSRCADVRLSFLYATRCFILPLLLAARDRAKGGPADGGLRSTLTEQSMPMRGQTERAQRRGTESGAGQGRVLQRRLGLRLCWMYTRVDDVAVATPEGPGVRRGCPCCCMTFCARFPSWLHPSRSPRHMCLSGEFGQPHSGPCPAALPTPKQP